jgi:SAM-dependent methyltransferase
MAKLRIFGKCPVNAYLRLNKRVWEHLPISISNFPPISSYGNLLLTLVRLGATRKQNFGTLFLRNRPQLELIRRLSDRKGNGSPIRISVMACSKGAEVYSILWTIRPVRPDLKVIMHAVDISKEVLEFAQKGIYSLRTHEFSNAPIFERVTEEEMENIFDKDGDKVKIKSWIKDGVIWHLGDAGDPEIVNVIGSQDMVIANNFLCHMDPADAEKCLRNIARLVKPGGYLFVSGIDLDVRTNVAHDLGWKPVIDLMEEVHNGDPVMRVDWPWKYWGLEPFDKRRYDWKIRYASAFQIGKNV